MIVFVCNLLVGVMENQRGRKEDYKRASLINQKGAAQKPKIRSTVFAYRNFGFEAFANSEGILFGGWMLAAVNLENRAISRQVGVNVFAKTASQRKRTTTTTENGFRGVCRQLLLLGIRK